MSFDDDNNENDGDGEQPDGTFFGLKLSSGAGYIVIGVLALILIRQVFVAIQAL